MKVIDLLNKIANGEEVPKEIRITILEDGITRKYNFFYDEDDQEYKDDELFPLGVRLILERVLNEKVEIIEEAYKEIDRLNKEYERIYNENCKLRENHNINDITLLDENERLNRIIDNIFEFMQNKYDNSDLTGFTISFMELQDLKNLKDDKNA